MFYEKELDTNLKLPFSDSSNPNKKVAKISIFYIFLHFILFYYFCVFTLSLKFMVNASTDINTLHLEANNEDIYMNDELFKLFLYTKQFHSINFLYKLNLVSKDIENENKYGIFNCKIVLLLNDIYRLLQSLRSISFNPQFINFLLEQIQLVFRYCSNNNTNLQVLSQIELSKNANKIFKKLEIPKIFQNVHYEKIIYASELKNNFTLYSNNSESDERDFQLRFITKFFTILKGFEDTIFLNVKSRHSIDLIILFYDLLKSILLPNGIKIYDKLNSEIIQENRIKNYMEFIKKNTQNSVIKIGEQRSFIVAAYSKMFKLVVINDLKDYLDSYGDEKISLYSVLSNFPPFFINLNKFIHEININIVTKVKKKENFYYNNFLVLFIIYNLLESNDFLNKKFINDSDNFENLSKKISNFFFDSVNSYKKFIFYINTTLIYFFANLIELNFYLLSRTMNIESVFDIFSDIHETIKQEIENCDNQNHSLKKFLW